MGGHAEVHPEGGLEGAVRKIFPKNYQMSLAIIGLYTGLYLFSKLLPGGKKKAAPEHAAHGHAAHGASDMPSADDPKFGDWLAQEGNFEKMLLAAEKA